MIEALNSVSRYLDDSLNIANPYFKQMGDQIYSTELELNKANSVDNKALFCLFFWRCFFVDFFF